MLIPFLIGIGDARRCQRAPGGVRGELLVELDRDGTPVGDPIEGFDLPMGIAGTGQWLRDVGAAAKADPRRVEAYIQLRDGRAIVEDIIFRDLSLR